MKIKKFKDWKEETKLFLFRVWVAGMVCWLMAMSPVGGGDQDLNDAFIQMVITNTLGLFAANVFVINPIARMMFNIKYKSRFDKKLFYRIGKNLAGFLAMLFIVIMIAMTYALFNTIFPTPPGHNANLMVEPFGFMLFFAIHFALWSYIYRLIKKGVITLYQKRQIKKEIEVENQTI